MSPKYHDDHGSVHVLSPDIIVYKWFIIGDKPRQTISPKIYDLMIDLMGGHLKFDGLSWI